MNVFWSKAEWEAKAQEMEHLARQDRDALERKTLRLVRIGYVVLFAPALPFLGATTMAILSREEW
jgi:hypothetical protein